MGSHATAVLQSSGPVSSGSIKSYVAANGNAIDVRSTSACKLGDKIYNGSASELDANLTMGASFLSL